MAGENEANFRICSRASEVLSYMPCPLQYTKPSNQNGLWVFWSQHNDEFLTVHPTTADTTVYHDTIKEKITIALKNSYISDYFGCWLIQFWAPVTTKDQIFLTTCDLPFGLSKLHEGLCLYRSECLKFRIPLGTDYSANEYQLGPTGRVFKHGFPEMSPDVSRYSITDYPQLGLALTAGLGNYLALPIFEPLSTQCTGVLEIIGDKKGSFSHELVQMIYEMLKKVDLRSANMYDHPDKKRFKGLERALKELEEQLNFICRTHQLPLAQTWLPILNGSNIERFMTIKEQFCIYTSAGYEFKAACDMFHLRKMQGVVGRAFLSRNSCFCSDITKLCMSEYPLAHVAHKVGLYSSFAICLQSSYTGDYVYLLEFFLPKDNKSDCRSPQTKLNMLLATMKRQFRSFKLASGRELGERLLVEVIKVYSDDGFNCFEICIQNAKHSSDVEAIASRKKILWLDKLNRLLNGGNTVNTCPENIDVTSSTTSANTITKVRNLSFQANISVCTSSEEESLNNVPEGQYRVNSIVLQQEVGAKVNGSGTTPGRLANHLLPNTCGREHHELNDMNCSSNQLDSAKTADRLLEETSGSDHSCHDTTASSAHATSLAIHLHKQSTIQRKRSNSFNSDFPVGDPERSAKVSKIDTSSITRAIKFCPRKAELRRELQSKAIHERRSSSSSIFRLGPRLADSFEGIGVGEAKATELYKKHHPPTLSDEVWRLENIGKDGAFHRRLHRERNDTVKDSLTDAAQSADQVPEDPPRPLTRSQAKLLHDFDIHLAWLGGNMSSDDWPNTRTEGYTYKFEPEDNVTGHQLLAPDSNPPGHLNCVRRQVRANDDCVRADPLALNTSIVLEGK